MGDSAPEYKAKGMAENKNTDRRAPRRLTRESLLHMDEDLIVVAKPPFVLSQDVPDRPDAITVQSMLSDLLHQLDEPAEIHLVHRLDEETTGALLIARNMETKKALEKLFHSHDLERIYHALVQGRPHPQRGTMSSRLDTKGERVKVVPHGGERAITHYALVAKLPTFSVVACKLETGKRNQIRAQFADRGNVLVGDRKYFWRGKLEGTRRCLLHATAISLRHPGTGEMLTVVAPFPADMRKLIGEELAAELLPG
jgi:23S rRNA pseudouridine1911/1915/1917 synthase